MNESEAPKLSKHPTRRGTYREASPGDWQCRLCGRVISAEGFAKLLKLTDPMIPICACSTWHFKNSDWRKLTDDDIIEEIPTRFARS